MSDYIRLSGEHLAIRKYGVAGSGAKTIVKIEVEVRDPHELGWLLKSLADAQLAKAELDAAKQAASRPGKRKDRTVAEKLALPAPLLGLPYFGERS